MLFAWITDPNAWLALGTLTLLEIVLGIDNIIFLSLVVAKLPTAQRAHARRLGLAGAMVMRLALLASIAWVTRAPASRSLECPTTVLAQVSLTAARRVIHQDHR